MFFFLLIICVAPFSSRNLSTAIFLTLNNFWLFDRKHFPQTFRSYVQRVARWAFTHLSNTQGIRTMLPLVTSSLSSLSSPSSSSMIRTANCLFSLQSNHTIFRSIYSKIWQKIRCIAFTKTAYSFYRNDYYPSYYRHHHHHHHSYLLSNLVFATRLICTSINCIFVPWINNNKKRHRTDKQTNDKLQTVQNYSVCTLVSIISFISCCNSVANSFPIKTTIKLTKTKNSNEQTIAWDFPIHVGILCFSNYILWQLLPNNTFMHCAHTSNQNALQLDMMLDRYYFAIVYSPFCCFVRLISFALRFCV